MINNAGVVGGRIDPGDQRRGLARHPGDPAGRRLLRGEARGAGPGRPGARRVDSQHGEYRWAPQRFRRPPLHHRQARRRGPDPLRRLRAGAGARAGERGGAQRRGHPAHGAVGRRRPGGDPRG
jgi:hypothetical protein